MATQSSIKHELETLVQVDIYRVLLIDPKTSIPMFVSTLTDTSIEFKENEKEVRAGVGNPVIASIPSDRSITLKVTDAAQHMSWQAIKLGTTLNKGAVDAYHFPTNYPTVSGTGGTLEVTLSEKPKTPAEVVIYKTSGEPIENATVTDKKVTIPTGSGILAGEEVVCGYYVYTTSVDTEQIAIDATKYGQEYTVVMESQLVTGGMKPVYKKQYYFPRGKVDGSFTESLKSERDAAATETSIKILKPEGVNNIMGTISYIPIVE